MNNLENRILENCNLLHYFVYSKMKVIWWIFSVWLWSSSGVSFTIFNRILMACTVSFLKCKSLLDKYALKSVTGLRGSTAVSICPALGRRLLLGLQGVTCYVQNWFWLAAAAGMCHCQTLGIVGNISQHMWVREDSSLCKSSFDIRLQKSQRIHQLCTTSNMPVCLDMSKKYLIYSLCSLRMRMNSHVNRPHFTTKSKEMRWEIALLKNSVKIRPVLETCIVRFFHGQLKMKYIFPFL